MSDNVLMTAMASGTAVVVTLMITRALVTSAYQQAAAKIAAMEWEVSRIKSDIWMIKQKLGLDKKD